MRKLILILTLLLILPGCHSGINTDVETTSSGGNTITTHRWGAIPFIPNSTNSTLQLNSSSPNWYRTGIEISSGDKLVLKLNGTVHLCDENRQISVSAINHVTSPQGTFNDGNSMYVNLEDYLEFEVGPASNNPNHLATSVNRVAINRDLAAANFIFCPENQHPSETCYGRNGYGLRIYVGGQLIKDSNIPLNNMPSGLGQHKYIYVADKQGYLSMNIRDPNGSGHNNAGGYDVRVKHLHCAAKHGRLVNAINPSSLVDRNTSGSVDLLITDKNPNNVDLSDEIINVNFATFQQIVDKTGVIWARLHDIPSGYADNKGVYFVDMEITRSRINASGGISNFVNRIVNLVYDATISMYSRITLNSSFFKTVRVALVLYITIYGIMFTAGMLQISQLDLVMRIFKLGIVLAITSDSSWNFFLNHFFLLFHEGRDFLINAMTGNFGDSNNHFKFIDVVFTYVFSAAAWIKIAAIVGIPAGLGLILVASPATLALFFLFIAVGVGYIFFIYFFAILEAIITYVMSVIVVGLMVGAAPIMIVFTLFGQTRNIFENWVKLIANFTLQPVLLIAGTVIINEIIVIVFYKFISYEIEFGCIYPIRFNFGVAFEYIANYVGIKTLLNWLGFPLVDSLDWYVELGCIPFFKPSNILYILTSIFVYLPALYFLIKLLEAYVDTSPIIVSQLTGVGSPFGGDIGLSGRESSAQAPKDLIRKIAAGQQDSKQAVAQGVIKQLQDKGG